ncbi:MAG: glycoside hydrolase family 3 N-terminal domain-containing protein [Desulfobacterales bacterium]
MIQTDGLSPEQIAGQRLIAGFDGTTLNDELKFLIDGLKVGGLILFKRNIIDAGQTGRLCRDILKYADSCGQPPLFIAVDQEGGQVARLPDAFTRFPGNPFITTPSQAEIFAVSTARDLTGLGINMNMAPVLDVPPFKGDSIMRERAFSHRPSIVSELGGTVIDAFQHNHIMSVAKHFPGIGRTTLDSHLERPEFDGDITDMHSHDLIPFQTAIEKRVAGIMLSHILYTRIDPKWPASLSSEIADNLLRKRMGYDGIVMTDDLDMAAITNHYNIQTVVDQILSAGIDIALICRKGPHIEIAFQRILEHLRNGKLPENKWTDPLRRIVDLKRKYLFRG